MAPKTGTVPKVFSPRTLEKFEAASASIPLRPLDRAFGRAEIPLGDDPGGAAGSRKAQFRRYVASVNQHDSRQLDRLGVALGALIAEVAASKVEFLVNAAESDGFVFADGVFRQAQTAASSFAVTNVKDLASIEERGRRLRLLADESPKDAIDGAKELVESVGRTVLHLAGKAAPAKTANVVAISKSALSALEVRDLLVRCLQHLADIVVDLGELRSSKNLSPRHARLAVGAAVTFAGFVAETYAERAR
jgi:hypothetical protein